MIDKNTILTELLISDYHLLPIIQRFGINYGFGDKTIGQICEQNNINVDFFLAIVKIYSNDDYDPTEILDKINILDIVEYLKLSHNYFLKVQLPVLSIKIKQIQNSDNKILNLINNFLEQYIKELEEHIKFEEEKIFPYIDTLLKNQTPIVDVEKYTNCHLNIEEKLRDLKYIFIKYFNIPIDNYTYFSLVSDISDFEKDLRKHQLFEEKMLIPKIKQLQNQ